MTDSEQGYIDEGLLLTIVGVMLPIAVAANVLTNTLPTYVVSAAMVLWIVWFVKWAAEGGMPRMRVR